MGESGGEVTVSRPTPQVRVVTLNRPDALNTLTASMVSELHRRLEEVEADRDCRVVVLTGAGRAFCAGLDLRDYGDGHLADEQGTVRYLLDRQRRIVGVCERLHSLRQPVIAAVNGPAAGGGLGFALASDIRLSTPDAVFAVAFIRAGFSACDLGTSWLLPRIVGAGRAHELMLTGRRFGADEALRIGLLTEVVPAPDLLPTALAKAREIMLNPPLSVELTKEGMWTALEASSLAQAIAVENRQQTLTVMTEDQGEAQAAFLEKRQPRYRDR